MSKCPDRFSRREACSPNPESFRETGVVEENEEDSGDVPGEGGDLVEDELLARLVVVEGLSLSLLEFFRMPRNAL